MRGICGFFVALALSATLAQHVGAQLAPASGEPRIDPAVEQASASLSSDQIKSLEEYVRYWLGVMQNGSPEDAVRARDALIRPFDRGGSAIFLSTYSPVLSRNLVAAAGTSNPAAGLNAMIVASRLMDTGAIEVIKAGLKNSDNVSVRYWAARAVDTLPANLAKRDPNLKLTKSDEKAVLDALVNAARVEQSDHVMRQLLPGIVTLTIPDARQAFLDLLDARLADHAANPGLTVSPELAAMNRLYRQVVQETYTAKASGGKINTGLLTAIARIAYLYLSYGTQALQQPVSPERQAELIGLVDLADSFLRFSAEQLIGSAKNFPGKPQEFNGNWSRYAAAVAQWPVILTAPPIGFPAQNLVLPEAK